MSALLLIGERLNTHRPAFARNVAERDGNAVLNEMRNQIDAGVTHLDVNASSGGAERERADLEWLIELILPHVPAEIGLVLDSPHPEILAGVLPKIGRRNGTILNGITANPGSHGEMLRLAQMYGTGVVAILTDGVNSARSADERMAMAEGLHAILTNAGIAEAQQYFDPQVLPGAFDPQQSRAVLECVRMLRGRWPHTHALAGVSNVSFNMPKRRLLNRAYATMLLAAGVDALLCDPCDAELRAELTAVRGLLGQDEFWTDYLAENG